MDLVFYNMGIVSVSRCSATRERGAYSIGYSFAFRI